jgi:hypothetical protein
MTVVSPSLALMMVDVSPYQAHLYMGKVIVEPLNNYVKKFGGKRPELIVKRRRGQDR